MATPKEPLLFGWSANEMRQNRKVTRGQQPHQRRRQPDSNSMLYPSSNQTNQRAKVLLPRLLAPICQFHSTRPCVYFPLVRSTASSQADFIAGVSSEFVVDTQHYIPESILVNPNPIQLLNTFLVDTEHRVRLRLKFQGGDPIGSDLPSNLIRL